MTTQATIIERLRENHGQVAEFVEAFSTQAIPRYRQAVDQGLADMDATYCAILKLDGLFTALGLPQNPFPEGYESNYTGDKPLFERMNDEATLVDESIQVQIARLVMLGYMVGLDGERVGSEIIDAVERFIESLGVPDIPPVKADSNEEFAKVLGEVLTVALPGTHVRVIASD